MTNVAEVGPVTDAVRLEIVGSATEGLIENVCRVLRHRQVPVVRLLCDASDDALTRIEVTTRVAGDVDLIIRQLSRIVDVRLVNAQPVSGAAAPRESS